MGVFSRRNKDGSLTYYVDYYDPDTYDPTTGKPVRVRRSIGPRKKDADREWHFIKTTILTKGTLTDLNVRQSPRFEEWAQTYLQNFCSGNAPKTLEMKRSQMETLVDFFGKQKRLRMNGIRPLHVLAYVRQRQEYGNRLYPGRPIARTVNMGLELLRHMWNCAKPERYVIGENPVQRACFIDEKRKEILILTEPEFRSILEFAAVRDGKQRRTGARLSDLILWIRFTGCRFGEALRLHKDDVNWILGQFTFKETKTGRDRTLPLLPHLAEILERQDVSDGSFFGPELERNRYRMSWQVVREESGFLQLTFHHFRHMASTQMHRMGVSPVVAETVLGHAVKGMMGRYTHPTIDDLADALTKLALPFPSGTGVVTNWSHGSESGPEGENQPLHKAADIIELQA